MINPDFSKYSLVLVSDGNVVFSSQKSGLRPLMECVDEFRGKLNKCEVHDKVIGLAAARLIVYSGMIDCVRTLTCSKLGEELLRKHDVDVKAESMVDNILTIDKMSICPMELKAIGINNENFYLAMKKRFEDGLVKP
ncbi:MAG: DUF1893 domain-containing protein [Candidatus Woesearchaeota archaeon]|jgi:hypothetical protein|nr:DUF1893 domain-containing protein [Candidatus Woesearchaeota archaeon]